MNANTLILYLIYNPPQTHEWVKWVVIEIIIGMLIYLTIITVLQYVHIRSTLLIFLVRLFLSTQDFQLLSFKLKTFGEKNKVDHVE